MNSALTKKKTFPLIILCFLLLSCGLVTSIEAQTVVYDFDDYSDGTYCDSVAWTDPNGYMWSTLGAFSEAAAKSRGGSGSAVRFDDDLCNGAAPALYFYGTDGNGKDGGIGYIELWYRHWDGDANLIAFSVEIDTGQGWEQVGGPFPVSSTTYELLHLDVEIDRDDILVRVKGEFYDERLILDDMTISDFGEVPPALLDVSPENMDFAYNEGSGPSSELEAIITASDLPADITVSASGTDFEWSTSAGGPYQDTDLIIPGPDVNSSVFVRMKSGLVNGTYNDELIFESDVLTDTIVLNGDVFPPSAGCADLFFSEYIEGSSNNKYLEIFNPTDVAIDLAGYTVTLYTNGSTSPQSSFTPSSGTMVEPYGTVVLANNSATIYDGDALIATGVCSFNGDDYLTLENDGTGALLDAFGQFGVDPGSAYGSGSTSSQNNTLIRKSTILHGDNNGTDPFDPADEWDGYGEDYVDDLGSHTCDCTPAIHEPTADVCTAIGPVLVDGTVDTVAFEIGGEIVAEIIPQGENLGDVNMDLYVSSTPREDIGGTNYLDRNLYIYPTTQPTADVLVRFYFTGTEFDSLLSASSGDPDAPVTVDDLDFSKVSGVDCASAGGGFGGTNAEFVPGTVSPFGDGYFLEATVSSFSGFYANGGGIALPVDWVSFELSARDYGTLLEWEVENEVDVDAYEVQHSTDGKEWEHIGKVFPSQLRSTSYSYEDRVRRNGLQFYRIVERDTDGDISISEVRSIFIQDEGRVQLVNSLTSDALYLNGLSEKIDYEIYDMRGSLMNRGSITGNSINVSTMRQGVYLLNVKMGSEEYKFRFVRQ